MAVSHSGIFAKHAGLYLDRGLVPLPIAPGTKACKVSGWNKLDPETDRQAFEKLIKEKAEWGIAVRTGARSLARRQAGNGQGQHARRLQVIVAHLRPLHR
jgi:hypothetical protein